MVQYRLVVMVFTLSLVYIFIVPNEPFLFKLFFKLLPMIVIIFYALQISPRKKKSVHWFIILGLIFSIIGDATLHWFLIGLTAFALAHICYLVGFLSVARLRGSRILVSIPIGLYAVIYGKELVLSLQESGQDTLILPVIAYIIVISIMLVAASLTGNKPATVGALLFVISDSILAWNKFVGSVPFADVFIMITYYTAQLLIAISLFSIVKTKQRVVW